jgi:hypothetical protein
MTQPIDTTPKGIKEFTPEYRPPVPTQAELDSEEFGAKPKIPVHPPKSTVDRKNK